MADGISKAFGISSAQGGYIIIPDEHLRNEYIDWLICLGIEETEPAIILIEICYTKQFGLPWLERLKKHYLSIQSVFQ